jgi:demethylmenaquinone methyltransferase/2-methoxy-6-polyprenyl-1,4-benzoquinol methylase
MGSFKPGDPAAVEALFDQIAPRYDLLNDLLSLGLHRVWKRQAVAWLQPRPGQKLLDLCCGTGDLARAFAERVGPEGEVWLTDINGAMLGVGRDRLLDEGLVLPVAQCDAEALPFPDGRFDRVTVAFGLRNMTRKEAALREMHRVLVPGGKLLVLEFSKVWKPIAPVYDAYSFGVLPQLGRLVAGDADSYRYLAESIRMHPDQPSLGALMESAGFGRVRWHNLTLGVVALHEGVRFS